MDVSVIIINYNTKDYTLNCISSIISMTKDLSFEIIVVDNGSSDGSVEVLSHDKRIVFINSGSNLGFGLGNNLGASVAKGEYLFFLNSDTVLLNNSIKCFWDEAQLRKKENIGVLGSWLLNYERKITTSYGSFPSLFTQWKHVFQYMFRKGKEYKGQMASTYLVNSVSGADMFISRSLFNAVGGFDKDYFMYSEEVELQYRINKMGFLNYLISTPQIIHFEGSSSNNSKCQKSSYFMMYSMKRGRFLFYRKHKSIFISAIIALLDIPIDVLLCLIDRRFTGKQIKYLSLYRLLVPFIKVEPQVTDKSFYN